MKPKEIILKDAILLTLCAAENNGASSKAVLEAVQAEMPLKRCSHCKEYKPRGEFYKNRSRETGLGDYCTPCLESTRAVRKRERERGASK